MKKFLFLAYLFCQLSTSAQVLYNNNAVSLQDMYANLGWQNANKEGATIKGSPMFQEEWSKGNVVFSNGRVLNNALLHFNLYQHRLFYQLDSIAFVFVDPVTEFTIIAEDKGDSIKHVFRNGYPGFRADGLIYYEVIAEGPIYQLLMFRKKILRDYYEYGSPITKIFRLVEEYFIFNKKVNTLSALKPKQSIQDIIPEKAGEIFKLTGENKFKFLSVKELGDVIVKLQ